MTTATSATAMAEALTTLVPRQIWAITTEKSHTVPHSCTPYILSSGGILNLGGETYLTLTQHAGFQPECTSHSVAKPADPLSTNATYVFREPQPFYTSADPQIYAVATVTAVSYMLVVMLFITPRTFFYGGISNAGSGFLGTRGVIRGSRGGGSVIGVGDRPWLQKAATLCVAISLTIVTADMFKWAERQYEHGYQDAQELSEKVIDGLEIRIVRVISETFLWLAQAQTLIRLFPRHKEKLVIKWTAFGLISLELIFSILNFFVKQGSHTHPRSFNSAIPAMDYLFALTMNLCYAAFIFYYALCKRRFAFYHQKMRNMPLVALISLLSVLTPIIFFILDLSLSEISGWGGYIRWVSAAAASVVVWEWVERIEALERDEKKDGILGREIFDGDEMLESNPSSEFSWGGSTRKYNGSGNSGEGKSNESGSGSGISTGWRELSQRTNIFRPARRLLPNQKQKARKRQRLSLAGGHIDGRTINGTSIEPPAAVASPVSRADTVSAASTVYRVRYHPTTEPTPPLHEEGPLYETLEEEGEEEEEAEDEDDFASTNDQIKQPVIKPESSLPGRVFANSIDMVLHPFRRQRDSPPIEVAQAISSNPQVNISRSSARSPAKDMSLLRLLHWKKSQKQEVAPAGVIVVPAPQQRRPLSQQAGRVSNASDISNSPNLEDSVTRPDNAESPPVAVLNALRMSPRSDVDRSHGTPPLHEVRDGRESRGLTDVAVDDAPTSATFDFGQPPSRPTNHDR